MNLFRIVFKEFTQDIRDWRSNALMILFPILLISVLGAALGGVFSGSLALEADALYTVEGDGPIARAFQAFTARTAGMGVRFTETSDREQGMGSVKDLTHACYLVISDDRITLYKNARFGLEADFVRSFVQGFLRQYAAARAIGLVDPAALLRVTWDSGRSYVEETSLVGERQPRSTDYYAVTLLTLVIMYASVIGMGGIKEEQKLRTLNRVLSAPVRRWQPLRHRRVLGKGYTDCRADRPFPGDHVRGSGGGGCLPDRERGRGHWSAQFGLSRSGPLRRRLRPDRRFGSRDWADHGHRSHQMGQ
jgi:ABC-2 type transport system permease protein